MVKNSSKDRIYFKNLNAIRFIAAFLVIIHHIEQFKQMFGIPHYFDNPIVEIIGKLGVVMFFVLSGFLISYLLFKEKEVTDTINIKYFYIRRLLKIWPLYFLIVFLAFFILPKIDFFAIESLKGEMHHNFFAKILLYVFFLPNLALRLFAAIPYASHLWSIGVEEQFYLIWPGLNKKINNKWLLMFGVIGVYLLIKFSLLLLPTSATIITMKGFWDSTPIDCMAIGGLFSLIIYEKTRFTVVLKKILFDKITQWFTLILTATLMLMAVKIPYLNYEVYAVLFGVVIVNFAANESRLFSMETGWTNYLGKISYGLYMYHPITIVTAIHCLHYFGIVNDYLLYPFVVLLTVGISAVSFEFFENRFIRMKTSYSKIKSGSLIR